MFWSLRAIKWGQRIASVYESLVLFMYVLVRECCTYGLDVTPNKYTQYYVSPHVRSIIGAWGEARLGGKDILHGEGVLSIGVMKTTMYRVKLEDAMPFPTFPMQSLSFKLWGDACPGRSSSQSKIGDLNFTFQLGNPSSNLLCPTFLRCSPAKQPRCATLLHPAPGQKATSDANLHTLRSR